jgi:hypothetical protein
VSSDVSTAPVGFSSDQIDQSASTRDVPLKWVVVVDEDLPAGRAVNAAICVAGATTQHASGLLGESAVDADGSSHPGLPWLGCTVLGAPATRLGEIRRAAAGQPGVLTVDMPTQAQHTRVYDDYLAGVGRTAGADLAYYAISLVGPRRAVDKLVRGLSLLP